MPRPRATSSWSHLRKCLSLQNFLNTEAWHSSGRFLKPSLNLKGTCHHLQLFFLYNSIYPGHKAPTCCIPHCHGAREPCCSRSLPAHEHSSRYSMITCNCLSPAVGQLTYSQDRNCVLVLQYPQPSAWSVAHRIGSWELFMKGWRTGFLRRCLILLKCGLSKIFSMVTDRFGGEVHRRAAAGADSWI